MFDMAYPFLRTLCKSTFFYQGVCQGRSNHAEIKGDIISIIAIWCLAKHTHDMLEINVLLPFLIKPVLINAHILEKVIHTCMISVFENYRGGCICWEFGAPRALIMVLFQ